MDDDENNRRVLTRDEQRDFIKYAKKSIYYNAFSLVLETGLRCGEIGGLQWSDIDLDSGFLYVKRTLLQDSKKGGFYYGIPKSKSSKRKVPLTDEAKNILLDQQKLQYKLKHQSHPQFEPDEGNILFSLLKFAENSKLLVSLEDEENSVTGFLKSFSDTQIELETVNEYGKYSGITVIDLEMVETISVDTDYEQDVKLLADNNTENGSGC